MTCTVPSSQSVPAVLHALLVTVLIAVAMPALAAKGGKGGGGSGSETGYTVGGSVSGLDSGDVISLALISASIEETLVIGNGDFTFSPQLPRRSSYLVSVTAQPDGVSCQVENASGTINKSNINNVMVTCSPDTVGVTYSVGGSLSGLDGSITLDNNGEALVLTADGSFTFPTELEDNADYNVVVASTPGGQSCAVANGSGTIAGTNVTDISVTCETAVSSVVHLEGAGDSIMRGYNASCTGNTQFWHLFCYAGGDQDQNSFLDGSSSSVVSLLDRYLAQSGNFSGSKSASASGSEMTAQDKNNFATQAAAIAASTTQPTVVLVELGGNDLCNRTSDQDLYSDEVWRNAVQAGLDILVNNLPDGSTVYLSSVPRVQDLRNVGIAKQVAEGSVDCESFWATYDVCRIATASGAYFDALQDRQQLYNEILAEEAVVYNAMAVDTGVEVVAEYQAVLEDATTPAVANYGFSPGEINGGDCFHPSLSGQNKLSEILWNNNPFR